MGIVEVSIERLPIPLILFFYLFFFKFSIPLCLLLDPRQQLFPQAATGPLLAVELVWHFCESFLQTGKAKEAPALLRSIPATRPGLPANQIHTFENIFHFAKGPFGEYFLMAYRSLLKKSFHLKTGPGRATSSS